jgi:transglutaminase-like putative cysteine protease
VNDTRRPTATLDPVASVCLFLLTAATVVSMCRLFADWDFLVPMLVVAAGVHVVAFALRFARVAVWLALPLLAIVLFLLVCLVHYRETLTVLLPTGRTFDLLSVDVRLVLRQFPTAVAPVPSRGNFAMAATAGIGLAAMFSDTFAFRAMGRVEPVVPSGVLFVFASALGTDNHRIAVSAVWVAVALLTVAVLRFTRLEDQAAWVGDRRPRLLLAVPAMVLTVGLGAAAAAAVAPRLPGAGERALIDTRNRQGGVTEVLSPLVDIRSRMSNRGNTELFTVQSSDGPHYWRAIALPVFDGESWSPAEESLQQVGVRPIPSELLQASARSTQVITIKSMRGHLVPAAYRPSQVSPDDVLWAPGSESLVLPDAELQRDDVVAVASLVVRPTPELLRSTTVSNAPDQRYYQVPDGLPSTARDAAVVVTSGRETPFDKALALQQWFRVEFVYDLTVQIGNSNDAIEAFLRERRGFCQQFAGTFAVMARTLGLPARVAVGYTPGDLRSDGLFHVFGRHAHAWPEVWFDGIGWVAFEPTPGRGSPDGVSYSGVGPAQDDSRGSNGNSGNAPSPSTSIAERPGDPAASTTIAGGPATTPTTQPRPSVGSGDRSSGATPALLLFGAAVALMAWMVLAPRAVGWWARRRRRSTEERVAVAWRQACAALRLAGAPAVAGSTPLEYADISEQATGVDHRTIRELAVNVTRATYSPGAVTEGVASRSETLGNEIDVMCRQRTPIGLRARAMVDPRMMLQRSGLGD